MKIKEFREWRKYLVILGFFILFYLVFNFAFLFFYSIRFFKTGKKTYTVLLQNNKELRATGGFMGSYAQLHFKEGILVDYKIEDIYVPDGAITWYIEPPEPIQEAFQHGTWRLADSNWDPDFPTSAKSISWFFDKAGVDTGNGIIAVNFEVLEDIFQVIGEVYLPDYESSISADSLYIVTQNEVEKDFFPGSTKTKDFLQHLTHILFYQASMLFYYRLVSILQ